MWRCSFGDCLSWQEEAITVGQQKSAACKPRANLPIFEGVIGHAAEDLSDNQRSVTDYH